MRKVLEYRDKQVLIIYTGKVVDKDGIWYRLVGYGINCAVDSEMFCINLDKGIFEFEESVKKVIDDLYPGEPLLDKLGYVNYGERLYTTTKQ